MRQVFIHPWELRVRRGMESGYRRNAMIDERKSTDEFTIIFMSKSVYATCPYCEEGLEVDFKYFDWNELWEYRETMRCYHCDREFKLRGRIKYD